LAKLINTLPNIELSTGDKFLVYDSSSNNAGLVDALSSSGSVGGKVRLEIAGANAITYISCVNKEVQAENGVTSVSMNADDFKVNSNFKFGCFYLFNYSGIALPVTIGAGWGGGVSCDGDTTNDIDNTGGTLITIPEEMTAFIVFDEDGWIHASILGFWRESPTFTGTPLVPTATAGTNTQQIASTAFVKNEINSAVSGLLDLRGDYDASSNVYPSTGGSGASGAIEKGDAWYVSVDGVLNSTQVEAGDLIFAKVNIPGTTDANWAIIQKNTPSVKEIAKTIDYTIVKSDNLAIFLNTGATATTIFTLPTVESGLKYSFYVNSANMLRISGAIMVSGTSVSNIQSNTIGNYIEIQSVGNVWLVTNMIGTWSDI